MNTSEFARICRTERRTIHYYDAIGLLKPDHMQENGYREYSAEQVADCYRLRWQIELAFKRLKSLLHLDALRAKEPELAKAWIFANLLAAFLIDDIIQPSLDFPPRSAGSEKKN